MQLVTLLITANLLYAIKTPVEHRDNSSVVRFVIPASSRALSAESIPFEPVVEGEEPLNLPEADESQTEESGTETEEESEEEQVEVVKEQKPKGLWERLFGSGSEEPEPVPTASDNKDEDTGNEEETESEEEEGIMDWAFGWCRKKSQAKAVLAEENGEREDEEIQKNVESEETEEDEEIEVNEDNEEDEESEDIEEDEESEDIEEDEESEDIEESEDTDASEEGDESEEESEPEQEGPLMRTVTFVMEAPGRIINAFSSGPKESEVSSASESEEEDADGEENDGSEEVEERHEEEKQKEVLPLFEEPQPMEERKEGNLEKPVEEDGEIEESEGEAETEEEEQEDLVSSLEAPQPKKEETEKPLEEDEEEKNGFFDLFPWGLDHQPNTSEDPLYGREDSIKESVKEQPDMCSGVFGELEHQEEKKSVKEESEDEWSGVMPGCWNPGWDFEDLPQPNYISSEESRKAAAADDANMPNPVIPEETRRAADGSQNANRESFRQFEGYPFHNGLPYANEGEASFPLPSNDFAHNPSAGFPYGWATPGEQEGEQLVGLDLTNPFQDDSFTDFLLEGQETPSEHDGSESEVVVEDEVKRSTTDENSTVRPPIAKKRRIYTGIRKSTNHYYKSSKPAETNNGMPIVPAVKGESVDPNGASMVSVSSAVFAFIMAACMLI
jgi:hypothetical protein